LLASFVRPCGSNDKKGGAMQAYFLFLMSEDIKVEKTSVEVEPKAQPVDLDHIS
jgi:hypothetical protein